MNLPICRIHSARLRVPYASSVRALLFIPFLLLLASCTAGGDQFTADSPAGFWHGLWHGVISFISLILHLFYESVRVYETNNTGEFWCRR